MKGLGVVVCLAATAVIGTVFFRMVDLQPRVDESFFFSKQDPQLEADNEIRRTFRAPTQIIVAAAGDIRSSVYAERLRSLSDTLAGLHGVSGVQSLSRGPRDLADALDSPLWSRMLIARDRRSSYVFVTLEKAAAPPLVRDVEAVQRRFDRPEFRVVVSGVPYVAALIGRNLARDLRTFSLAAILVFGLVLFVIFRSPWVLLGTFVTCADSSALTLIVTQFVHIPIGPLTANLSTIVFVMTLSPIVFLTFNGRRARDDGNLEGRGAVRDAVKRTIVPSCWSALCMLLGFISLLFVPSTPMRHLGIAGAIGAAVAFAAAYTIYPWFLERAVVTRPAGRSPRRADSHLHAFFAKRHGRIVAALAIFTLIGAAGLLRLNTDPALPSYFKQGGDIRIGLEFVDRNGGSSPLKLVVEDRHHAALSTDDAFHRLWKLQQDLEQDPAVGGVVSIATVLSEAKRHWLANFVSTDHLIKILDHPKYGEVSRQLINPDRSRALFVLRMRESQRAAPREEVISRLIGIVEKEGFHTVQVGGAYSLLNQMARLLGSSIISGVLLLIGVFVVLGYALSRSVRVSAAMLLSLGVIPVVVRGYIAYVGMPLDFITAAAANIDLGMGVDAMIYLTMSARRAPGEDLDRWSAWSKACSQLWRPIGTSLVLICSGFGIFLLSSFPPTQRFGVFVMFGSAAAATTALFMFPWLATILPRARR
jgi:predicted RND superfamily exporter protein